MHELKVMTVYEKSQYVMRGKLFSSYRTVFELVQADRVFEVPKQMT